MKGLTERFGIQTMAKLCFDGVLFSVVKNDYQLAHEKDYVDHLFSSHVSQKIIEAYELIDEKGQLHRYRPDLAQKDLSELWKIIQAQVNATYTACVLALEHQVSYFFGGGMHHAYPDRGTGFCLVNDIAISLHKLKNEKKINHAWVIDVDAHKGDGTAAHFEQSDWVKTFSLHMAHYWPLESEEARANSPKSFLDVELETKDGATYLKTLINSLKKFSLLNKNCQPDLIIIVLGADPFYLDVLPSSAGFQLSLSEMLQRDLIIEDFLKKQHCPHTYLMAGGYGEQTYLVYQQYLEHLIEKQEAK
jgi:acetoin utilization deacetylase AcuC-like enzyme